MKKISINLIIFLSICITLATSLDSEPTVSKNLFSYNACNSKPLI